MGLSNNICIYHQIINASMHAFINIIQEYSNNKDQKRDSHYEGHGHSWNSRTGRGLFILFIGVCLHIILFSLRIFQLVPMLLASRQCTEWKTTLVS